MDLAVFTSVFASVFIPVATRRSLRRCRAAFAVASIVLGSFAWGVSLVQDDTGFEANAQATYIRQYKPVAG
jgi:hypothetical protein